MDQDKIFKNLGVKNQELWVRLQEYSETLNLQGTDAEIFTTDKAAAMSYFVNSFRQDMVSVGDHLARAKAVYRKLVSKKEEIFGTLYVKVTDECIKGRNSSKFDKEYRTGKVHESEELKELTKLIIDVGELVDRLEAIQNTYQLKGLTLTTMVKLDKYNF